MPTLPQFIFNACMAVSGTSMVAALIALPYKPKEAIMLLVMATPMFIVSRYCLLLLIN